MQHKEFFSSLNLCDISSWLIYKKGMLFIHIHTHPKRRERMSERSRSKMRVYLGENSLRGFEIFMVVWFFISHFSLFISSPSTTFFLHFSHFSQTLFCILFQFGILSTRRWENNFSLIIVSMLMFFSFFCVCILFLFPFCCSTSLCFFGTESFTNFYSLAHSCTNIDRKKLLRSLVRFNPVNIITV